MNRLKKYIILLFSIFVVVGSSFAKEIFVSNANPTAGDGTLLNPYNTIQQAADVAVSGDIITIRAGVYREEVKMVSDGVTYRSYSGEIVVLNGTEQLKEWTLVPGGSIYEANMDFDAPENILQYPTNQLFVDQKMIELARWPNQTSSNISIPSNAIADDATSNNPPTRGQIGILKDLDFDEPDGRWVGATIWINLSRDNLDGQGWTGRVIATDRVAKTITYDFRQPVRLGHQPWSVGKGTEYFLFNPTKAGVDATGGLNSILDPGEWLKFENTVYVNMPNGLAPNPLDIGTNIIEAKKRMFAFRPKSETANLSYYTIKDLNLFASTITTDTRYLQSFKSIKEDANFNTIQGINGKYLSHFTEINGFGNDSFYGRSGIILSGRNSTIKDCNIEFSGSQGISILGEGNKALNNVITSANYMVTNAGAIITGSICIDCEIGYNTISNTSHIGINFAFLKNSDAKKKGIARIHHNKLYDFLLRSNDSGGINDVSSFGNWARLDHNLMYKTFTTTRSDQDVYGLYFDFNEGSYLVDHNVVYGMKQAMLINKVKNMSIYNNTFLSYTRTEQGIVDATGGDGLSDTIRNNILSGAHRQPCCTFFNLNRSVFNNNISNAFGNVQNDIFIDPAAGNFQLKSTAVNAIDKGVNTYQFKNMIIGNAVDLGAFEFGAPVWTAGPTTNLPPVITPNSGEYIDQVLVNITTDITGNNVAIRYTLDGKEPSLSSPLYTNPITLTDSAWVKSRVFVDDIPTGEIASGNLLVTRIADIPPISLRISKPTGNYPIRTFVELSSPNPEIREIRYTLDGTEPTVNSILYINLLVIDQTTTIKAIAVGKFTISPTQTSIITITAPILSISPNGGNLTAPVKVTISANPAFGSKIYYTLDGSTPVATSTDYTTPISISSTTTLKAIAINGTFVSEVKTAEFISPVSNVIISPISKTFKDDEAANIALTTSTPNANIYYTLDGSTPNQTSSLYNGVPINLLNTKTVKAVAYANGLSGTVSSETFTVLGPEVVIAPQSGNFKDVFNVTLSSSTGSVIYYTTNGSTPTASSTRYTAPFEVNSLSTTINAIAIRNGNVGAQKSATYTIDKPMVTISPDGANTGREVTASITSSIPGAIIYYTIDGSTPTKTSLVYANPLAIKQTLTIKAIAIKGSLESDVREANFTISLGEAKVVIFPNPISGGQFSINFNRPQKGQVIRVSIYDVLGRLILKKSVTMVDAVLQEESFDVPYMRTGTYIIKMKTVSAHLTDLLDEEVKLVVK